VRLTSSRRSTADCPSAVWIPLAGSRTINAIETGKYDPSLPVAFKVSLLFDLRIEEIFDPGNGASANRER
jgi:hypothetical protein